MKIYLRWNRRPIKRNSPCADPSWFFNLYLLIKQLAIDCFEEYNQIILI